ncbi:PucR family transcriptional regulator [Arthrobacter sp. MA-N2]|uniref:PucR family transcriptional regulator n=1 Tax=Arthrobacter sp. MA-N2 TaxID=1101188 RepID=UPI000488FFA3|nr:helix-turn-helix domain-containing protein [Arthrobacter sp. MA-N2]
MADYILATLTDWPGGRDEEEIEALRRATEASTVDTLLALFTGDHTLLVQSLEPNENIAFYVRRAIPLDQVIRNVYTGQEFLTQELLSCIDHVVPEAERMRAAQEVNRDVADSWSQLVHSTSVQYSIEYEKWTSSRAGLQASIARSIIEGKRVDPEAASKALGYEVEQWHTGIVLWLEDVDAETAKHFDFESAAKEIRRVARVAGSGLMIRNGLSSAHVWLGCRTALDQALRDYGAWPPALRIATGYPHQGPDGFRRTHLEAKASERVARLSRKHAPVTSYESIELVSLLLEDVERARSFVLRVLGPMASNNTRMQELRHTLSLHIDTNGSLARTAQGMHTHRNTVSYRLQQISGILPAGQQNYQIRCALELAEMLPDTVLIDANAKS